MKAKHSEKTKTKGKIPIALKHMNSLTYEELSNILYDTVRCCLWGRTESDTTDVT